NTPCAAPAPADADVEEAVDRVGLRDVIDRLPAGLDTPVHERGVSLSSGERQLLALARAFLAHPRVPVLDEATSSLDLKSEGLVETALDVLLEGRTAIIVAHRLSTAMKADRIVVIHDGPIVEAWRHDAPTTRWWRPAAATRTSTPRGRPPCTATTTPSSTTSSTSSTPISPSVSSSA